MPTDAELAEEYWSLQQAIKANEERKAEISAHFKRSTGERVYGSFFVSVASTTKQLLDGDACKALLGDRTPFKAVPQVTLTVKKLSKVVA